MLCKQGQIASVAHARTPAPRSSCPRRECWIKSDTPRPRPRPRPRRFPNASEDMTSCGLRGRRRRGRRGEEGEERGRVGDARRTQHTLSLPSFPPSSHGVAYLEQLPHNLLSEVIVHKLRECILVHKWAAERKRLNAKRALKAIEQHPKLLPDSKVGREEGSRGWGEKRRRRRRRATTAITSKNKAKPQRCPNTCGSTTQTNLFQR